MGVEDFLKNNEAVDKSLPAVGKEYLHYEEQGMAAYRAPSLFQPHKFRQAIRDAHEGKIKPINGYFYGMASVLGSRLIAQLGADTVWLDWEHISLGVENITTIAHQIAFISQGKSHVVIRIPGHDHASIGYALDCGASVMVPQVNTVEDAKHVTEAAKFGHRGTRSAPPMRFFRELSDGRVHQDASLWENLNRQAAVIIQIETAEAVHNLDAILTECGDRIDAVWLGSLDLRVSMGLDIFWGNEPEFTELVDKYYATLKKHDKPSAGFMLPGQDPKTNTKSLLVGSSDVYAIMAQVQELQASKEIVPFNTWTKPADATNGHSNGNGHNGVKETNGTNGHRVGNETVPLKQEEVAA